MRDRSLLTWLGDLVACEFTLGLEPILQIMAGLFTALEIKFVCATSVEGCLDRLLVLGFDDTLVSLIFCFRASFGHK
jgi:hypothetical protein